jgi:uncharacterized protein (DUF1800 family)
MSLLQDQHKRAHVALNRFGLGGKVNGINRIRLDPKAAIQAELNTPNIALITAPGLPTYQDACQMVDTADGNLQYALKDKEMAARIAKHLEPEVGFVERLVLFFSNHFSMTFNKDSAVLCTIGQLERDVIRKNVLGSFRSMLVGVMLHPAMIRYLDNQDSVGPTSPFGIDTGFGLNHNLAREICELHTMGVGSGYTEADIDSLAKMLTGWSYVRGYEAEGGYYGGTRANRGRFIFRADWHEPGAQTMLGKTFSASGLNQAIGALSALADHPATAQFIAFKLVRHFITDQPTPAMVDPVALAFKTSRGNLKAVAQALINLPEAWSLPLTKLRTPYELQIAEMRATGRTYRPADIWEFYGPLYALRHAPWERPAPDGYPDESAYWMGPDAMRIRLETAQVNAWGLQQQAAFRLTAPQIADLVYGQALSAASRQAVAGALTLDDGLTTLFMLHEFQRR